MCCTTATRPVTATAQEHKANKKYDQQFLFNNQPDALIIQNIFYSVIKLYMLRATSLPPDDGQRRCPKHVEFYDRIKNFE